MTLVYDGPIGAYELRNQYEEFYKVFRNYLWPYHILEDLANVEVEIYTDFCDLDKLKIYLAKLRRPVKDVVDEFEDNDIQKQYDALVELVDQAEPEHMYYSILQVEEVNPDEDKQIKSEPEQEEQPEGSESDYSFQPETESNFLR